MTKRTRTWAGALLTAASLAAFVGCSESEHAHSGDRHAAGDAHDHDHDHAHDHGSHGPHDGRLIELGHDHEYHAELVTETDGRTVRLYVLDHDLEPKHVDSSSVALNLIAEGEPYSFKFAATSAGISAAEFIADSQQLWKFLEEESFSIARLNVYAEGVTRMGTIDHHDHAHAGHTHADGAKRR